MASPETMLDDLVRTIFGAGVTEALDDVSIIDTCSEDENILEVLAERYLPPEVNQQLPQVEARTDEINFEWITQKYQLRFRIRGWTSFIFGLTVAAGFVGADAVIDWLRILFGTQ